MKNHCIRWQISNPGASSNSPWYFLSCFLLFSNKSELVLKNLFWHFIVYITKCDLSVWILFLDNLCFKQKIGLNTNHRNQPSMDILAGFPFLFFLHLGTLTYIHTPLVFFHSLWNVPIFYLSKCLWTLQPF